MQFSQNSKFKLALPYLVLLCLMVGSTFVSPYFATWEKFIVNNLATAFSPNSKQVPLQIDGTTDSIIGDSSGGFYIGGDFSHVGPYVGEGVLAFTSTGSTTLNFSKVANGIVYTSIQDGSGGWYIGGNFTTIDGLSRNGFAHIFSDGSLDKNFNLNATINYLDYSLALSTSTGILYAGGSFVVSSVTITGVIAINTSNGNVINTFNTTETGTKIATLALSPNGNTLYLGGTFSAINGVTHKNIAAVNTSDGSLVSAFNASSTGSVPGVDTLAISPDGNILYLGGFFTAVDGTARNHIAAVNTSDGSLVSAFNAGTTVDVVTITLSPNGSTLYLGGDFTSVDSTTRNYIAAVNTSDGSLVSAFNPNANNPVSALTLSPDGNTLYLGGMFTSVHSTTRNYMAAVNTSDGSLVGAFNPNPNGFVHTLTLSPDGSAIYIGGEFTFFDATNRKGLAHILSDGSLDQNFNPSTNGTVYSLTLSSDGSILYLGGSFTTVDSTTRNNLAAVKTTDGSLVSAFNSSVNALSGTIVQALTLSLDGNTLYLGGYFTSVDSTTRNNIAAVNITDGSLVSAFHASTTVGSGVTAVTLSSDGSILYLGGSFTTVDDVTHNSLGAVHTADGSLVSAFNPNVDAQPNTIALSPDGNTLYLGGWFSTVDGTPRSHIAAVNTSDGSLVSAFNASVSGSSPDLIFTSSITPDGEILYIGGKFDTVDGTPQLYIAALNTSDGSLVTTFNPTTNTSVYALAISPDGNALYVGAGFYLFNSSDVGFGVFQGLPGHSRHTALPAVTTVTLSPLDPSMSVGSTTQFTISATDQYGVAITPVSTTWSVADPTIGTIDTTGLFTSLAAGTTTITVTADSVSASTSVTVTGGMMAPLQLIATTTSTTTSHQVVPQQPVVVKKHTVTPATTTQSTTGLVVPINVGTTTPVTTQTTTGGNGTALATTTATTTNIVASISNTISNTIAASVQLKAVSDVVNSQLGSAVTKTISTTGVVAGASAAISAVTFANPITFAEIWLIPTRIFGLLVGAFGIRRKNRPWGTVYDSVTKRPIDPAYVSLIDTQTGKEVASAITDLDGRYSFAVLPGTYKIIAKKTNYLPSTKLASATFDEVYNNLYHGDDITIQQEGQVITKNIPMDPQTFDWNEFTKNKMNVNTFVKGSDVNVAKISKILFVLGFIVSLIGLVFSPAPYNLIIAGFYILAYLLNYFVFKTRKAGSLIEKSTNMPLSFAIVKIFREGDTEPLTKKIADKFGKYYSLVPKGNYFIKIDKKLDDGTYAEVFHSGILNVKNGVVDVSVRV